MELSRKQLTELRKMARYFDQLEPVAAGIGTETDCHAREFSNSPRMVYSNFKNQFSAIASGRQDVFIRAGQTRQASLTVIVNEDRF